jgi:esterase/lipase
MRTLQYIQGTTAQAVVWQQRVRLQLAHALKLEDLRQGGAGPLTPQVLNEDERDGYTYRELEINSTPGRRVSVVLTLPTAVATPVPAVVCIHGHGGDRYCVYDADSIYKGFAGLLAAQGYATIAVDVGQHAVYDAGRILMGERLWDLWRCVDYLETLPSVDAGRIGCGGLSLGGEMAMWLGAMDERMRATLSAGFLTTMDQMEHNHCMCWKFDGLRELVDYADLYALTAPRALQCQNGLQEKETQFNVPLARTALAQIEPIYRDFGQAQRLALHVHKGGHEIDAPALLAFFKEHL